jgi:hypothetical protein
MTGYAQRDPALQCIDCGFATYSENNALTHETDTGHSTYSDEWPT